MTEQLRQVLAAYLAGDASRRELRQILVEFDWDDGCEEAERLREVIATLDLILEEVSEGLREEAELLQLAQLTLSRLDKPIVRRLSPVVSLPSERLKFAAWSLTVGSIDSRLIPAGR